MVRRGCFHSLPREMVVTEAKLLIYAHVLGNWPPHSTLSPVSFQVVLQRYANRGGSFHSSISFIICLIVVAKTFRIM